MSSSPPEAAVPLGRVSTVDALVAALRQRILGGQLPAGSPLREAELCQEYGVSRHSLRTALQILVQSGLASREPNRSVLVATLTKDSVEDIYRLRSLLEIEAVTVLCARPELLEPVRMALRRMEELPQDSDWASVRDADLEFHAALINAIDSPRTARVFASLLDELRLAYLQLQEELEDREELIRQHRSILTPIEHGHTKTAVARIREQLDAARHDIGNRLS